MSDEDLIADLSGATMPGNRAGSCKVCLVLTQVSEPAKRAIEEAMSGKLGSKPLAAILTRNGHSIGSSTIRRHRKGHTS